MRARRVVLGLLALHPRHDAPTCSLGAILGAGRVEQVLLQRRLIAAECRVPSDCFPPCSPPLVDLLDHVPQRKPAVLTNMNAAV